MLLITGAIATFLSILYYRRAGGIRPDLLAPAIVAALTLGAAVYLYYQERYDEARQVRRGLVVELRKMENELGGEGEGGVQFHLPTGEELDVRIHLFPMHAMREAARQHVLSEELGQDLLQLIGDLEVYNRRVELFLEHALTGDPIIPEEHYRLWRANLDGFFLGPLEENREAIASDAGELLQEIEDRYKV